MEILAVLRPGDPARSPRPARVPLRVAAVFLDVAIFVALVSLILFRWGRPDGKARWTVHGLAACGTMLLWPLYWLTTEAWFSGTLGKRLLNLTVFSLAGSDLEFHQVLKRGVSKVVDLPTLGLISSAVAFSNPLRQTPGDLWAGTVVTEDKLVQQWRHGADGHKFDDWLTSFKKREPARKGDEGPVA